MPRNLEIEGGTYTSDGTNPAIYDPPAKPSVQRIKLDHLAIINPAGDKPDIDQSSRVAGGHDHDFDGLEHSGVWHGHYFSVGHVG